MGRKIKLHHLIFEKKIGYRTDHINRKPLDNRKCNLRYATASQNNINSKIRANNTSGIKGISYRQRSKRWRAYISIDHKMIELGEFINKEEAIKVRKEAEEKYHGEFAMKLETPSPPPTIGN